ncbi:hypothetical protein C8R44DRAFT_859525 [Mycena epipterygia]|nr:hypothetical protein C8R44DRAFT_859525 [Mycena epipterygia]
MTSPPSPAGFNHLFANQIGLARTALRSRRLRVPRGRTEHGERAHGRGGTADYAKQGGRTEGGGGCEKKKRLGAGLEWEIPNADAVLLGNPTWTTSVHARLPPPYASANVSTATLAAPASAPAASRSTFGRWGASASSSSANLAPSPAQEEAERHEKVRSAEGAVEEMIAVGTAFSFGLFNLVFSLVLTKVQSLVGLLDFKHDRALALRALALRVSSFVFIFFSSGFRFDSSRVQSQSIWAFLFLSQGDLHRLPAIVARWTWWLVPFFNCIFVRGVSALAFGLIPCDVFASRGSCFLVAEPTGRATSVPRAQRCHRRASADVDVDGTGAGGRDVHGVFAGVALLLSSYQADEARTILGRTRALWMIEARYPTGSVVDFESGACRIACGRAVFVEGQ